MYDNQNRKKNMSNSIYSSHLQVQIYQPFTSRPKTAYTQKQKEMFRFDQFQQMSRKKLTNSEQKQKDDQISSHIFNQTNSTENQQKCIIDTLRTAQSQTFKSNYKLRKSNITVLEDQKNISYALKAKQTQKKRYTRFKTQTLQKQSEKIKKQLAEVMNITNHHEKKLFNTNSIQKIKEDVFLAGSHQNITRSNSKIVKKYIQTQSQPAQINGKEPIKTSIKYYNKLKQRLKQSMIKIDRKKFNNAASSSIKQCQLKTKDQFSQQTIITKRKLRMKSLTRTGLSLNVNSSLNRQRPKTSRINHFNKIYNKAQAAYIQQKLKNDEEQWLKNKTNFYDNTQTFKNQRSLTLKKSRSCKSTRANSKLFDPTLSQIYRLVQPIHKNQNITKKNQKIQNQKSRQKMLTLLIKFQDYANHSKFVKKGANKFKKFCKKMNSNLQQTKNVIQFLQGTNGQYD